MSGLELAKKISELESRTKIFLATTFDILDLKSKPVYRQAKIGGIIQKPIKFSKLVRTIEQSLKDVDKRTKSINMPTK